MALSGGRRKIRTRPVMADDRAPQMQRAHCEKQQYTAVRLISSACLATEAEYLRRKALSMIGQVEGWLQVCKPQRCTAAFGMGCRRVSIAFRTRISGMMSQAHRGRVNCSCDHISIALCYGGDKTRGTMSLTGQKVHSRQVDGEYTSLCGWHHKIKIWPTSEVVAACVCSLRV